MPLFFRWILRFVLLAAVWLLPENARAQVPAKTDSLAPDTIQKATSSDRIIKGLQEYSKRKSLPARVVSKLFNFDRKRHEDTGLDAGRINYEFSEHDYKIVRRIEIKTLDPFGYSLTDTAARPDNFFEKNGNHIHIKTHRGRVRNKLLFQKGEQLEPQAIVESERLLRQTDHIQDARITVNEATTTADSVDIIVVTRDIFSISGSFGYSASKTMSVIGLRDVNFLGLGHQFRNKVWLGIDDLPQSWQYQGSYMIENLYRTYITGRLIFLNDYKHDQRGINFNRDFYTNTTKYAGGIAVNWFKDRTFLQDSTQDLRFNSKDFWLARSYKLKSYTLGFDNPGRLIVGARIVNTNFTQTPTPGYLNTTLYLASIGYSYRKYYKDHYLFGFGRTEDIPAGNLMTLTMGYEYATTRMRQYLGVKSDFGKYKLNFGYLYASAEYGSFFQDGKSTQGVINTNILYFTKLYNLNGWLIRNFVWNRMTYGLNREPGEILRVNNYEGLRGFSSGNLAGQNRFTLNLESNIFTPVSFVGFRLALVFFADLAWLSKTDDVSPFKDKPYRAYGTGIRFRNEFMGFSTIQVLLVYYPRIPEGDGFNNLKLYENSRRYYEFRDFNYSQPVIAPYR